MKAKDILELAMYSGKIMLESGAEVYRVEDTIARICKSFGASRIECTVTVTGMDASVFYKDEAVTLVQRVRKKEINLTKIERINQLSRDLALGEPDLQKAKAKLDEIDAIKSYKPHWLVLFSGISSVRCSAHIGAQGYMGRHGIGTGLEISAADIFIFFNFFTVESQNLRRQHIHFIDVVTVFFYPADKKLLPVLIPSVIGLQDFFQFAEIEFLPLKNYFLYNLEGIGHIGCTYTLDP